jgi:hypothetical protein
VETEQHVRRLNPAFFAKVRAASLQAEPDAPLGGIRRSLPETLPERLLTDGLASEAVQQLVADRTKFFYKYTVDDRIPINDDDVATAAGMLRLLRAWLAEALHRRDLSLLVLTCCLWPYLPFDPDDLDDPATDKASLGWLGAEAGRLLQSVRVKVSAHDEQPGSDRLVGVLGGTVMDVSAPDVGSLVRLLDAQDDIGPPSRIAALARLLFHVDQGKYLATATAGATPLAAWVLVSSLGLDERPALTRDAEPGNRWLFFEAFRQTSQRGGQAPRGVSPDDLASCLRKLAESDEVLFDGTFLTMRARPGASLAFGLALGQLAPEHPARVAGLIEPSEYDSRAQDNTDLLTGLERNASPAVVASFCTRVNERYRELASRLWDERESGLLTPLTTDCSDFISRHLSAEVMTPGSLDGRVVSALDRIAEGESQWAHSAVQRKTRFLVAVGELCLLSLAARRNGVSLTDGVARQRLGAFLEDPRYITWYYRYAEGTKKLQYPRWLLDGEPSPRS